jgi:iron complex transport system ATP-binding protein
VPDWSGGSPVGSLAELPGHRQVASGVFSAEPALVASLHQVSVVRDGRALVDCVDWEIAAGERWAVLGPNGSGKTTLLQVVGARLWPTRGVVHVLGAQLGRVDLRTLRPRVALVSGSVVRQLRPTLTAREVVVTGRHGALEPWWHPYANSEWAEADRLLAEAGVGGAEGIGHRAFGVISEGERQVVLLCRALMAHPELLLLDEPAAGLDLGARERLVSRLSALAGDPTTPPLVMVTHHVEEIPRGITHAALIRQGRMIRSGPLVDVLTSALVSECFGVPVKVGCDDGRWWSRATE